MTTTLSSVATQNELNLITDNTLHSTQPFTARSPEELSLAHLISVSRNIGDSNNAYVNSQPVELMLPASTNKVIPSQTKAELAQRLTDSQQGKDVDKIEQVVAGVATLYSAQLLSGMESSSRRSDNEKTGKAAMTTAVEHSAERVRSHAVVDGGTDITPANTGDYCHSNVMGNTGILDAFTAIFQSLNLQEAHFNVQGAKWSQLTMTSANTTGQHLVRAAQENQTGAIVAGTLSVAVQSVSAVCVCKALNKDSASIENHLKRSHDLNEKVDLTKNGLQNHQDSMISDGAKIDDGLSSRLITSHPKINSEIQALQSSHQQAANTALKRRIQAESVMQASRPIHDITQGAYGVTAAEQNKQAEIMRANQTVSGEVDSVHQQTGKKSSEGESALRQALLTILNNNNDAVSAVASKMA